MPRFLYIQNTFKSGELQEICVAVRLARFLLTKYLDDVDLLQDSFKLLKGGQERKSPFF